MDWFLELPSPLRFLFVLPIEFGIVAMVMFTLKRLGVNIKTPWLQGIKNAFFMSLILCTIVGLLAAISIVGIEKSASNAFTYSFSILWGIIVFGFFFSLFSARQKAGQTLLDIAPISNRWLFIIIGILVIGVRLSTYADPVGKDSQNLVSTIMDFSSGTFFIIMGFSRTQIHEHGILAHADLIRWNRIESYEWITEHGTSYSLKLKYKGKLPEILRTGALPVPPEKKAHVASLLKEFLPEGTFMQDRA